MPGAVAPSLEELLREMEHRYRFETGGKTTREWAAEWGMSDERARGVIRHAVNAGRMVGERELRPCYRPGHRVAHSVYRFVSAKRKPRANRHV